MEKSKTCCIIINDFCNFRYLEQSERKKREKKEKIISELCRLKELGVTRFISGCEEGLDLFLASLVLNDNSLSLECVCAYEEQSNSYSEKEREKFFNVLKDCEKLSFISRKREFGCKTKRDKYMIEKSDYILCFWDKISPYTGELLQFAAQNNKIISYI